MIRFIINSFLALCLMASCHAQDVKGHGDEGESIAGSAQQLVAIDAIYAGSAKLIGNRWVVAPIKRRLLDDDGFLHTYRTSDRVTPERIVAFDLETGDCQTLTKPVQLRWLLAYSPKACGLVTGNADNCRLIVWNLVNGQTRQLVPWPIDESVSQQVDLDKFHCDWLKISDDGEPNMCLLSAAEKGKGLLHIDDLSAHGKKIVAGSKSGNTIVMFSPIVHAEKYSGGVQPHIRWTTNWHRISAGSSLIWSGVSAEARTAQITLAELCGEHLDGVSIQRVEFFELNDKTDAIALMVVHGMADVLFFTVADNPGELRFLGRIKDLSIPWREVTTRVAVSPNGRRIAIQNLERIQILDFRDGSTTHKTRSIVIPEWNLQWQWLAGVLKSGAIVLSSDKEIRLIEEDGTGKSISWLSE